MAISLPRSLVFQDRKNEEDFLEGENSDLNREVLELYRLSTKNYIKTNPLAAMNEAWYITKWTFMQKEPKLLQFERVINQYIYDIHDSIKNNGCMLAYYILKRQKSLPKKISEFLPEMEKICLPISNNNNYYQKQTYDTFYNFLNQHNDNGYTSNLYLEVTEVISYKDIEYTTNFKLSNIKRLLPYYGNIKQQLALIDAIEAAKEAIRSLPAGTYQVLE